MGGNGFKEGYLRGSTWEYDYIPGGPSYNAPYENERLTNPEWFAECVASKAYNNSWHTGFSLGLSHKKSGTTYSDRDDLLDILEENCNLKHKVKHLQKVLMSFNFSIGDIFKRTTDTIKKEL